MAPFIKFAEEPGLSINQQAMNFYETHSLQMV